MDFNITMEAKLLLGETRPCADMEKTKPYLRHFFERSILVGFTSAEKTHVDIFR